MAYKKDVDYSELIDQAVAKGDYKTAAQYEQQRNEKIQGEGLDYAATNRFGGWLDDTDYGTIGLNQIANGASKDEVKETYYNRYNKAANTEGLTQYADDEIQKQLWDYITSDPGRGTTEAGQPTFSYGLYQAENPKPTHESSYSADLDAMLNEILNRDDFSYNANSDPLFQQYKEQYNREGTRAMNDTLAAAAIGAGGMNSYAVTAAQEANNYYASQLGDKVPELYQLAYEMYLDDIDGKVRDLGLLQGMDDTQYNRYLDTLDQWRNDRDFAYGSFRDDMGDYKWSEEFGWQKEQDTIGNQQWSDSFQHQKEQAAIGNQQWQQSHDASVSQNASKDAYNRAMDMLKNGVMPSTSELQVAGISNAQAETMLKNGNYKMPDYIYQDQISNLGLDANDATTVDMLFSVGALVEDNNGNVSWADGWTAENYKTKLNRSNYTGGGGGGTRYTQHLY